MTRTALVYTCHDAFPSSDANTQQIFRTVLEVTRLGVAVELTIPALAPGAEPLAGGAAFAAHYGVAPNDVPRSFGVRTIAARAPAGQLSRGLFDLRTPAYLAGKSFDLAWTRDPLAAAALARRGVPVVFETFRPDLATRTVFAPWRRGLIGSPAFQGLITHSHAAANAFVAAGVPRDRCLVAHNGFEPALMTPELTRSEARALVGLPADAKILMYTGHPVRQQGIGLLLDIAGQVPDARVVVVGADRASPDSRWLSSEAGRRGLGDRLELRAWVPSAAVAPYLYAADVLVVPPYAQLSETGRRGMLPIKVFTYLAAGRAILAPRLPDLEEVLTADRTARLYDPENIAAAVHAVKTLLADDTARAQLGRAAKAASAGYTWSARAQLIVAFFDTLASRHPRSAVAAAASSR